MDDGGCVESWEGECEVVVWRVESIEGGATEVIPDPSCKNLSMFYPTLLLVRRRAKDCVCESESAPNRHTHPKTRDLHLRAIEGPTSSSAHEGSALAHHATKIEQAHNQPWCCEASGQLCLGEKLQRTTHWQYPANSGVEANSDPPNHTAYRCLLCETTLTLTPVDCEKRT